MSTPGASPGVERRTVSVLYLINSMGAGGAEQSLSELLPQLRKRGIDVHLVTLRDSQLPGDVAPDRGDSAIVCGGSNWISQVLELRKIIHQLRPDLIHTTLFDADIIGRVAGRLTTVPVLTSLVNTTYDGIRRDDPAVNLWKLRAVQAVDGLTARHLTARFHAITHAVKDSAVRTLAVRGSDVTVIARGRSTERLGVPSAARRQAARRQLGLDDRAEVVVAVGRQEWQKGQEILVQAFDILAERRPLVHLLLVGRPGHASDVIRESIGRSRHASRIMELGHRDDVAEMLMAADVFAFPSRYEGLGGAVLEAMALGLPIVATNLPALAEVVENGGNGWLVPVDDIAALAQALDDVLGDDELRIRMGTRSGQIFASRFTLDRSADGMANLYREVLRG